MNHINNGMLWKEIKITDIDGIRIGNAQDYDGMTGVTVIIFDGFNTGGIDISGGGPASRESYLLAPLANPHPINAIVLSGGSAFGLAASTGVMRYLEERKIGYRVHKAIVPLVCQSCIFDFAIGNPAIRPDEKMGYKACIDAERNTPRSGDIGAGTGATVGKINGRRQCQKSGIGYYAVQIGELKLGAIVVVNAVGDVFDYKTGEKIRGMMNKERTEFLSSENEMYRRQKALEEGANTTLGVIITNGEFNQSDMNKIASMSRAAFGKCINPVGTMADGDTIYAMSIGNVKADISMVGTLAATVLSEAIYDAVTNSDISDEEFISKIEI